MDRLEIYGFALAPRRILYQLKNIDSCYLVYPNNVEHYLDLLLHSQPTHVLGLGYYSGIYQDKIRIETVCVNKFGNKPIDDSGLEKIEIDPFLVPNETMKLASHMGNSHCNFISWKIMRLITTKMPNCRYTFLHVPKSMISSVAIAEIDMELLRFRNQK